MPDDMQNDSIPFNWPYMTGRELDNIAEAHRNGTLAGDGPFTRRCHEWIERRTRTHQALLTHSCTAALEIAALLLNIQPGDEVIMPSYTYVSTANAFVLRGAVPVFVDVREDTLNLDEQLIESAISPRTRAIVPVHYAGVACEMDTMLSIAKQHRIKVVEDAAQGIMARYRGRTLGALGDLGAYSFHETKNLIAGEGGCLLVNDPQFAARAEIIREKGTDRNRFFRGEVDKYTWQDLGSSFLPGELISAFLWAQLEQADRITMLRKERWQTYHQLLEPLERKGVLRRPVIPDGCEHNAHLYYVLLAPHIGRQAVLEGFRQQGIGCIFHYVPLHTSEAGRRYGRMHGNLRVTESVAERVIRLPLWIGISDAQQQRVVAVLEELLRC